MAKGASRGGRLSQPGTRHVPSNGRTTSDWVAENLPQPKVTKGDALQSAWPQFSGDPPPENKSTAAVVTPVVADLNREEINARLETVEAKAETRFVELSGKLDRIADSIQTLSGEVGRLGKEVTEVKSDNKYTRWTIIVTVIASTIAAVALVLQMQGNLLSAFQSGLSVIQTHQSEPPPSK